MRTELPERWREVRGVRPGVTGVEVGLVPDPLTSLEAWARWTHSDIRALSDVEVWAEIRRLEDAAARGHRSAWVLERLRRLYDERARRKEG
jgi:hypothetical protein